MTNEKFPMAQNDVATGVNYSATLDEQLKREQEQKLERLELINLGPLSGLAPTANWPGSITATGEYELGESNYNTYLQLQKQSMVATVAGGQRACMDGRELEGLAVLPAPKTAGGTFGDAMRIMLAAHATGNRMSYEEALETAISIDESYGFKPGGHALDQCGAWKNGAFGIATIAEQSELVSSAVQGFLGAVGGPNFSAIMQSDITKSAEKIASSPTSIIIPATDALTRVESVNATACPKLSRNHAEISLAVILREGVTTDNTALITKTVNAFGKEIQGFGYNWDYHLQIAKKLGGLHGEYYLQTVPSQDIPVLTQLTDGTVNITAVK